MFRLKVVKPLNIHQMTILPGSEILISHEGSAMDRVNSGVVELIDANEKPVSKRKPSENRRAKRKAVNA